MAHSSTPKPDIVSPQMADEDFIPLETTQDANKKISQEDFGVLEKPKQNRKRNLLSDNSIANERDAHKQPRTEIYNVSDEVSSVSNEHSDEYNDFWIEFTDCKTSLNMNSYQKESPADNVFDSEGSKEKIAFTVEDTLAVPSPSHLHENIHLSNVCQDEETKETSLCLASEYEIIKYVKETKEEIPYQYCQCKYIINENEKLRRICLNHFEDPFFCSICKVRYSEKNSHERKHLCNFCLKEFLCITQLEDHFSNHEEDFKIDCIVCKREIKKHAVQTERRLVYKCCQAHYCSFESNNKWQLVNHLYTHFKVKIFKCNQCKERFTIKQNLQSHSRTHPLCSVCWKTFFDLDYLMLHISEKHL